MFLSIGDNQVNHNGADILRYHRWDVGRLMARSSDSNFLIALFRDKTFQAGEIRRVILISVVYLIVTTALMGVIYHQLLNQLLSGNAPLLFVSEDIELATEAIPGLGAVLGKWLLVMLGVNVLITLCISIYISRRLGRPILALKRTLREISNGNLDVKLRASDNQEFGEIVTELSEAMLSIRLKIGEAKQSMQEVTEQQAAANETPDEAKDSALDNCRSALDFFQTDSEESNEGDTDDSETELTLQDEDAVDGSDKVA